MVEGKRLRFCGRQWMSLTRKIDKKQNTMILCATACISYAHMVPQLSKHEHSTHATALRRALTNKHRTFDDWHVPLHAVGQRGTPIPYNQDLKVAKLISRTSLCMSDVVRLSPPSIDDKLLSG